jgi:two-component system, oxyanion-binding sensor
MSGGDLWRIGLVPLTDAAVLIAAAERGFARAAGVAIELVPKPSWASLRDELALGHLDAAHVLAPLAVAVRLGLSGPRVDLAAAASLNLNGNALTVSLDLWDEMAAKGAGDDVAATARAFVASARRRAANGRPLVLGTVFPYSSHTYQLRALAALGGGRLEDLAQVVVVPPPRTAEALRAGRIDGFCVGSPWNSVAVAAGTGRIAAFGCEIVPDAPEKILALPRAALDRAKPLVAALEAAAAWCAAPENRGELAEMLAAPGHLGLPAEIVRRTLDGRLVVAPDGAERVDVRYLVLGATVPRARHARWIAESMAEAGQAAADAALAAAKAVYGVA